MSPPGHAPSRGRCRHQTLFSRACSCCSLATETIAALCSEGPRQRSLTNSITYLQLGWWKWRCLLRPGLWSFGHETRLSWICAGRSPTKSAGLRRASLIFDLGLLPKMGVCDISPWWWRRQGDSRALTCCFSWTAGSRGSDEDPAHCVIAGGGIVCWQIPGRSHAWTSDD